ncbi:hypothetical protein F2P56_021932 [Juglans regia]|uniref:NAC domain-containing protein 104-like n=2 Tax=Juglans regia TaxID=51240 RepID=A0A833X9Z0_JUGRE|nr:NAC domain-containing protein 104-like [Juglans regia]KAF5457855.1 hypothetical protein F2P56_021932 [Juglans regia]
MGDNMSGNLPPGFRFCPTDEELVLHFLFHKASLLLPCHPSIIPDLDLCLQYDPWDFNGKTLSSGRIFYFFSRVTENRVTKNGYWKDLDTDETVLTSGEKKVVGIKRYFVFCIGQAPAGFETSWIMQEYHLYNHRDSGKWVLCRVHEREQGNFGDHHYYSDNEDNRTELSSPDEVCLSIMDDDLDDQMSFA